MKKIVCSLALCTLASFASTSIDGFSSPESVIVKNNNIYVSNVGKELKPTLKDGDGFISKLDINGKITDLHFIDDLDAPKGMEIIDNTLYVADIDALKAFDLKTKKKLFSIVFKGVKFLNDIEVKDKKTLFISASDANIIFEVNLKNKSYKKLVDLKVPNGLFYEDGVLYVAQLGSSPKSMFDAKGSLYKIDLTNKNKLTKLARFKGILDGVWKINNKIYVSDWVSMKKTGIIRIYDLKTKKESILKLEPFLGAADFWIDEVSNKLYLPQMLGNKLSIIELNQ